ncbi:MAG: helix-turn-helix domain-containing protein [Desulfovibrio sp.]|jgi:hypothetical protein
MDKDKINQFSFLPDTILTIKEVSKILQLDPRTVSQIAYALGGRRVGRSWRFRWGTLMEFFNDANFEKGSWECLVSQSKHLWRNCRNEVLSAGQEKRPGMDGSPEMGNRTKKRTFTKGSPEGEDPYGLRAALGVE